MNFLDDNRYLLEAKRAELKKWFEETRKRIPVPIYGSVDIRDSGWKASVIDANHFPAGFNNIATEDEARVSELLHDHIMRLHEGCNWVHLYPESHTRNPAYVENLKVIKKLIEFSGLEVTVGSPELEGHGSLDGLSGPLKLDQVEVDDSDSLLVHGRSPCLVLLNNDLSGGVLPGLQKLKVSPPPEMGWNRRRKSEHYAILEKYIDEVSELIGIDPWHLSTAWFVSKDKCLDKENCRIELAAEVDHFIEGIKRKYEEFGIEQEPVVFVKNDRGTYGLGILSIKSGEELLNLSNRKMNKLSYSKGGADVENFLIQEGVPTRFSQNGPIEPVVYLIDGEAASWFYRHNSKKGDIENLNTPSAQFLGRSEMSDEITCHAEGWHALVAELSMLAMGDEMMSLSQKD